MFNVDEV